MIAILSVCHCILLMRILHVDQWCCLQYKRSLQEDRSLLVAIESIEDHEIPEGAAAISRKTKKRHRADVMPGSSIRFEALPPSEGESSEC